MNCKPSVKQRQLGTTGCNELVQGKAGIRNISLRADTPSPVPIRVHLTYVVALEGPIRMAHLADTGQIAIAGPSQAPAIIKDGSVRPLAPDASEGAGVLKKTGGGGGGYPEVSVGAHPRSGAEQDFLQISRTPRREKVRRHNALVRDGMRRLKLSLGCQSCGYKKSARALEFHHTSGKDFRVSQCRTWIALYRELPRCTVLCANCHAELHEVGAQFF